MSQVSIHDSIKKTIVFFVGDYLGHIYAVVGAAKKMLDLGFDVKFFTIGSEDKIRQMGFDAIVVPEFDEPDFKVLPKMSRSREIDLWLNKVNECIERVMADIKPDLIIFDPFLLMFYPYFWRLGVRCASFSSKPLIESDPLVPPFHSDLIPQYTKLGIARIRYEWAKQKLGYFLYRFQCLVSELMTGISHRTVMLRIAENVGFPIKDEYRVRYFSYDMCFNSVPELLFQAKEFDFPRKSYREGHSFFVGPCIVDAITSSKGFAFPEGDGPLIYCHLGTVATQFDSEKLKLYECVINAVEDNESLRLVVSTCHELATELLKAKRKKICKRISINTSVPQHNILSKSSLLVTHGGGTSIKEAIHHGVPMLAFPRHADQPGSVARLVFHGLGERIRVVSTKSVSRLIEKVVGDERYKTAVLKMRDNFELYNSNGVIDKVLKEIIDFQ
ncbi:nucleotide disphospho-sugar-binding domain-containing protein [Teredinibacter sp. KSP-S5-2]|uniref:nucleotide disphospho-sugar-binding domain-containing protein n=1 Tax=Teredinibacter sp. KSP-S5-2 TaxID=3034506 RepID=UPI0029345DED|nr:nucleotide disphospho-sugar-binding domain-containing protein [Teredinibacter sp. KSP-S5-2]WNO11602.1 glycosyltransferase [Teredinibacter sp. KSP-S5-2]